MRGLYLVTDRGLAGDRPLEEVVLAAVEGGAGVVQLREKELATRAFVESARRLKALLEPRGIPLIVNDRVDVALAAGADGVQQGQEDKAYPDARPARADAIIGLSVETPEDVRRRRASTSTTSASARSFPPRPNPTPRGRGDWMGWPRCAGCRAIAWSPSAA